MGEKLTRGLEAIRLLADKAIWQGILKKEGISERLRENPRVLLIGTDFNLTLAREILATFPGAQITIVERDKEVFNQTEVTLNNLALINVTLVLGDFSKDDMSSLKEVSLVVAKHLIHFPKVDIKQLVDKALKIGPIFFASVPPVFDYLVDRKLKKAGIEIKKTSLGSAGQLYCFERQNSGCTPK